MEVLSLNSAVILSETPDFQPEMTKTEVLSAISEKVLGEGKLIGTYSRSGAFRTL